MNIQDNGNDIYNERRVNVGDVQMQQQAAPGAAPGERGGGIQDSFSYKLLTQGIKSATAAAQKGLADQKNAAALHKVASENARNLFLALKQLHNDDVRYPGAGDVTFMPSTIDAEGEAGVITLRTGADGHVVVRNWETGQEADTGLTVQTLRERLANEIFADPDILESGDYIEVLRNVIPGENDDIDTNDSFQRRCYEQALDRWVGIGADRLVNLTTANLRVLAEMVCDDIGTTAIGMKGVVLIGKSNDGFEIFEHNAARFEEVLGVLNRQVEANRLESEDAQTLIEALRKEAQSPDSRVDQKVVMNPNAPQPGGVVEPNRREATQPFRDFAADLIQMQDPIAHDTDLKNGATSAGKSLARVIDRHAETLARLLIDEKTETQNLDEMTKKFLSLALGGLMPQAHGLRMLLKLGDVSGGKTSVADLAQLIRERVSGDTLGENLQVIPIFGETKTREAWLTDLGDLLNKSATVVLKDVQRTIAEQLDNVFRAEAGEKEKPFEDMNIDEMFADATKPKEGSHGYTNFVKEVLGHYFATLAGMDDEKAEGEDKIVDFGKYKNFSGQLAEDRRNVVAAMLRYAPDASGSEDEREAQMLGALLKGTGPLLQKMLQGLDAGMLGDNSLGKVLKDMKKNLAPLPDEYVKAQLLDIVNRSGGKITQIERGKTLGCASVAQAMLCRIKGPGLPAEGKTVVVKLQRPNALTNLNREKALILKMAENNLMRQSYEGMIRTIEEEFDFLGEANNIREGEVYDTGFERVKAVKADPLVPTTPTSLVMECAPGETVADEAERAQNLVNVALERLNGDISETERANLIAELKRQHELLVRYQKDLSDLSVKWVTEGLFGSGKFHGDLHGGNIMVSGAKGVTLIDFGNVTKLTEEEQRAVTKMAAAASIGNKKDKNVRICVDAFLDGLSGLLSEQQRNLLGRMRTDPPGGRSGIVDRLSKVLKAGTWEDAGKRIYVALSQLQMCGIEIPPQIFKFSQSQMRLQNEVDRLTGLIRRTTSRIRRLTGKPTQSSNAFVLKNHFNVTQPKLLRMGYGASCNLQDILPIEPGHAKLINSYIRSTAAKLRNQLQFIAQNDPRASGRIGALGRRTDRDELETLAAKRKEYCMRFATENESAIATLKEKVALFGDGTLVNRYNQLREIAKEKRLVNRGAFDPDLIAFVDLFMEAELNGIESHANELASLPDARDDELKSFAESMGTAIKQNLKAASKRIGMELYRATV